MENKFYTYVYYDPSRNNEPIYVGKGKDERAWKHLQSKKRHPFIQRLQFMRKHGVTPVIGFYSGFDDEFAQLLEQELISKFGRKDLGKGPLLNLTDGGEGTSGIILSEDRKQKISNKLKGVPKSPETKAKMSKSTKGKPKSDSHKMKLSVAATGKPGKHTTAHTTETRAKISKTKREQSAKRKNNE